MGETKGVIKMYNISNIVLMKQVDYCVWHVVFQMDDQPLEFATDFLFLLKERKWVVNSLVTHELTSLMEGHTCVYCGETKIACFASSNEYKKIKEGILTHEQFLCTVRSELKLSEDVPFPSELIIVNNKAKWDEYAAENRFFGNLQRIIEKQ